jgi:S1-C subfamily serine protease
VVGRIVDLESRRPLAGARVRLSTQNKDLEATTDAAGKFRVEGPLRGLSFGVEVETAGHLANQLQRTAPMAGETLELGDIPLLTERKGPATGRAGIVLGTTEAGAVVVNDTIEDLPAAKAGLRRGDLIIAIDGHDLANVGLGTAVALIRGQSGTPLTLDVRQPDAKPRRLRLVRG